jgi:hypothetical protein
MSLASASAVDTADDAVAPVQRPVPRPLIRRLVAPVKIVAADSSKPQPVVQTDAAGTPKPAVPSAVARTPIAPKKRTIQMISDTADALKRVEAGEAKRLPPTPMRESATGFIAPPVQTGGLTPAARAMQTSQLAIDALRQADYNKINSVIFLSKRLHHDIVGAVVAETALDLARSGRF